MDIEIFPHRVLGSDTTEKLLNDLESIEDVKRTVIHGPRFPKTEETLPPQYRERRVITVNGEDVALQVKTGRIFVELTMESTIKEIEEVCKKDIPYGFDINQDRANYIRKEKNSF
jgi:methyl-coenzyme M reductase subunit D